MLSVGYITIYQNDEKAFNNAQQDDFSTLECSITDLALTDQIKKA